MLYFKIWHAPFVDVIYSNALDLIKLVLLLCGHFDIIEKRILFQEGAVTMAKTANLYARIEPEVKEQAESILSTLGIPVSNAINMFYKQIILQRGIPFEMKLPQARVVDMSKLTSQELDEELEKGYQDVLAGRTKPASKVFEELRRDYGI